MIDLANVEKDFDGLMSLIVREQYLVHDSLDQFEPIQKHHDRFSRFRTGDRKVSLYFTMGRPFPLKIVPSHERTGPNLIYMVPWAHPSPQPKRHLNRFSSFAGITIYSETDRHIDRPTD